MFLFDGSSLAASAAIAIGIIGISLSAHLTVKSARSLAQSFGLSDLVIGLTIVSIGTSLPEIFVNVLSGQFGKSGLGIGIVIGSTLGQITLILGLSILIAGNVHVSRSTIIRDGGILVASTILIALLGANGQLSRAEGVVLIFLYAAYIAFLLLFRHNKDAAFKEKNTSQQTSTFVQALWFILSLILLYASAELIVQNGLFVAQAAGMGVELVGILSGIGTSMPELFISIIAITRGAGTLSIGNLIGSNITDTLLSLGTGITVHSYIFNPSSLLIHYIYWVGLTFFALALMWYKHTLRRWEGTVLICSFCVYVLHVFYYAPVYA